MIPRYGEWNERLGPSGLAVLGVHTPELERERDPRALRRFALALTGDETFEALSAGLQGALWELGGSPRIARSDNLSAATHELKVTAGRGLTTRYRGEKRPSCRALATRRS